MPLCVPSAIVRVTLDMPGIVLTAAGLGFLGLVAQPMPEWGAMIAAGPSVRACQRRPAGSSASSGTASTRSARR